MMPRTLNSWETIHVEQEAGWESLIQSGRFGEEKNLLPMLGFEPRIAQSVA